MNLINHLLSQIVSAQFTGITSQAQCYQSCLNVNAINGALQGFVLSGTTCACKSSTPTSPSLFVIAVGATTTLIGNCATYASQSECFTFDKVRSYGERF